MKKLSIVCLFLFLSGCATNYDFQPKKESSAELGVTYKEINAKLAAGNKYQDLSTEAQGEYIRNLTKFRISELIINSNKISDETKRQSLLSLSTPQEIKTAIQESQPNSISSKSELIDEINKTEKYYDNKLGVRSCNHTKIKQPNENV